MTLIALLFILLFIGFLLYKRFYKLLVVFLIALMGLIGYFINVVGIEDYYGRNNHVFFQGKKNDIVILINKNTNQIIAKGQIEKKSWNRVFIKSENETLELNKWLEKKAEYMANIECELKKWVKKKLGKEYLTITFANKSGCTTATIPIRNADFKARTFEYSLI